MASRVGPPATGCASHLGPGPGAVIVLGSQLAHRVMVQQDRRRSRRPPLADLRSCPRPSMTTVTRDVDQMLTSVAADAVTAMSSAGDAGLLSGGQHGTTLVTTTPCGTSTSQLESRRPAEGPY